MKDLIKKILKEESKLSQGRKKKIINKSFD